MIFYMYHHHRQDTTYFSFCWTSCVALAGTKERRTFLFHDALSTFYLRLYGKVKKILFYLMTPLEHIDLYYHRLLDVKHMFIFDIVLEETRCRHIGYSFSIGSKGFFLYAPSHRQDITYHGLCYTSCGALAGTRNSLMGPPRGIDPTTHRTSSGPYVWRPYTFKRV